MNPLGQASANKLNIGLKSKEEVSPKPKLVIGHRPSFIEFNDENLSPLALFSRCVTSTSDAASTVTYSHSIAPYSPLERLSVLNSMSFRGRDFEHEDFDHFKIVHSPQEILIKPRQTILPHLQHESDIAIDLSNPFENLDTSLFQDGKSDIKFHDPFKHLDTSLFEDHRAELLKRIKVPASEKFSEFFKIRRHDYEQKKVDASKVKEALDGIITLTGPHRLDQIAPQDCALTIASGHMLIEGYKDFAALTNAGLRKIAQYYFHKYNIDIEIADTQEKISDAVLSGPKIPGQKAWGIIATTILDGTEIPHVTPLVCYKKDEKSPVELIELDSINDPSVFCTYALNDLSKTIKIYSVKGMRQVDRTGCRTDALVVLKQALTHLNSLEVVNIASFLESKEEVGKNRFVIPSQWAKTVQSKSMIERLDLTKKIYHPNPNKRETLGSFLDRYRLNNVQWIERYEAQFTVDGEKQTALGLKFYLKSYNIFLNIKGKKFANLVKDKNLIEKAQSRALARI